MFIAYYLISSKTNFDGLFWPQPPSIKEKLFVLFKLNISADGKKVGAAEVALPISLNKKFFYISKRANLLLKIYAGDFYWTNSRCTAVTITEVPGIISDNLAFWKYLFRTFSIPIASYFDLSKRLFIIPPVLLTLKIYLPWFSNILIN
jgi:hypothetical protein